MRKRTTLFFIVLTILFMTAGISRAGIKDMLLCLPGFPGTQLQAQPYLDKMLRYLETQMGWKNGSLSGVYLPDGKAAVAKIAQKKPGFALVGPSVYVSQHAALKMKVIAKVVANGRGAGTYSIITRKDGPGKLSELANKTLEGAVVHDAKYVHNVLLRGAIPVGKLKLKTQKRPLKALRDVARGKVEAAIVDQSVLEHLKELPFAGDVRVIFTSKPVPPPAVVVMGKGTAHAEKLGKALVGLCGTPDGKALCETLTISSIKAATDADYKALLKTYRR